MTLKSLAISFACFSCRVRVLSFTNFLDFHTVDRASLWPENTLFAPFPGHGCTLHSAQFRVVKEDSEKKGGDQSRMARVAQLPVSLRTGAGVSSNDQELSAKPSKHKVVLESVTQEKKKLRSVVGYINMFSLDVG